MNRIAAGLALLLVVVALPPRPLAQTPPAAVVALTNARVIDGTGRAALSPATIVIKNGRVDAIGRSEAVTVPRAQSWSTSPAKRLSRASLTRTAI